MSIDVPYREALQRIQGINDHNRRQRPRRSVGTRGIAYYRRDRPGTRRPVDKAMAVGVLTRECEEEIAVAAPSRIDTDACRARPGAVMIGPTRVGELIGVENRGDLRDRRQEVTGHATLR